MLPNTVGNVPILNYLGSRAGSGSVTVIVNLWVRNSGSRRPINIGSPGPDQQHWVLVCSYLSYTQRITTEISYLSNRFGLGWQRSAIFSANFSIYVFWGCWVDVKKIVVLFFDFSATFSVESVQIIFFNNDFFLWVKIVVVITDKKSQMIRCTISHRYVTEHLIVTNY